MSTELLDHCLELLAPLGPLRSRRMFGGWGIYADDLFIAIIAFEQLYLKADAQSEAYFEAQGCTRFSYEREGQTATLRYFCPPEEAMESPALMAPWGRLALEAAVRARAQPAKTVKTAKPAPARSSAPKSRRPA